MPRLAFDVDEQFSQEFNELVQLTGASSKADAFRKAISLYKVVTIDYDILVNEIKTPTDSVTKVSDYTHNNLDSTNTEEILNQIDLAQARINKDQEDIHSLAEETDKLLNQLKYKGK